MNLGNRFKHNRTTGLWRCAADFAIAASAYACLLYVGACSLDAVLFALIDEPEARAMIEQWSDRFLAPSCPLVRGVRQRLGGQ